MFESIEARFRQAVPAVDFCSIRMVSERSEVLVVRQDVLQPVVKSEDQGAMLTVWDKGGMGYAATSDLSYSGIRQAIHEASTWAHASAAHSLVDFSTIFTEPPKGEYAVQEAEPWQGVSLADKIGLLRHESGRLRIDPRIVDWDASLWHTDVDALYLTADGGRVQQSFSHLGSVAQCHRQRWPRDANPAPSVAAAIADREGSKSSACSAFMRLHRELPRRPSNCWWHPIAPAIRWTFCWRPTR